MEVGSVSVLFNGTQQPNYQSYNCNYFSNYILSNPADVSVLVRYINVYNMQLPSGH